MEVVEPRMVGVVALRLILQEKLIEERVFWSFHEVNLLLLKLIDFTRGMPKSMHVSYNIPHSN